MDHMTYLRASERVHLFSCPRRTSDKRKRRKLDELISAHGIGVLFAHRYSECWRARHLFGVMYQDIACRSVALDAGRWYGQ